MKKGNKSQKITEIMGRRRSANNFVLKLLVIGKGGGNWGRRSDAKKRPKNNPDEGRDASQTQRGVPRGRVGK